MANTMLALVYRRETGVQLETRPVPSLQHPRDAIVKVIRSTICTSDLHIKNGFVPRAASGIVLGHEFVGEVVECGRGVTNVKPGDRVAANCETFCGECWFCKKGFINNCQVGGWELGCRIDGCQAEYVRVPFADTGLSVIPECLSYEDALFAGDILSSGYFGAELADIHRVDTVAVIGAGPVGLCASQCAKVLGAGQVICLDVDPWRLQTALREGVADRTLNPSLEDWEAALREWTHGRGADAVIEAAGGANTFEMAWTMARPNAVVSVVAMYEEDQVLPLPRMYGKNLQFKTGGVDARHVPELLALLAQGKLRTDFLITHRGPLQKIEEGYRIFEEKREPCLKWVVTPQDEEKF